MTSTLSPETMRRKRLLALLVPDLKTIAAGVVSGLIAGATELYFPQAIGVTLDRGAVTTSFAAFVAAVLCLGGLSRFAERFFFANASQRLVARLRGAAYESLLRQEIAFFDDERSGELTSRLMNDAQALEFVLVDEAGSVMRAFVLTAGGGCVLLWMSPYLTLVMIAVLAPIALYLDHLGRRAGGLMRAYQAIIGRLSGLASEAISGIRAVRASDQEAFMARRFEESASEGLRIGREHNRIYGMVRGISAVAPELGAMVVILVGLPLFSTGKLTTGDLAAFVFTGTIVLNAVRDLAGSLTELRRASGALDRVAEILCREPKVPVEGGLRPDPMKGEIVFDDVAFAYPSRPDAPVLRGLNLVVHPGEVVALVGASGAGKSTLAGLLLRFHDPQSGRVLIDGADSRTLDGRWLRRRIGFVAQEPTLFAMTIAENIRFGLETATTKEIEDAARAANAHDFISGLPAAYETRVGDRGVQLSGGQRQRIALARTVLKDPRILILDEATSALDSESEALIHEALDRLMKGRTTLVIAHRLSTIRSAERAVVIEGGAVAAMGSHESLMRESSTYKDLVERQIFTA
ncbi:MAG: ABC transporter ATP-binding protein [Vicinamibacteria bacterium]